VAEPNLKSDQSPLARLIGFILLGLLVFTPLHSKVAGGLWFVLLLAGVGAALYRRPRQHSDDSLQRATRLWFHYMVCVTLIWWACALIWNDPWSKGSADLHSALRLAFGSWALMVLTRFNRSSLVWPQPPALLGAIVLACFVALILAVDTPRNAYPGNAIAWAGAVGFLVCILTSAGLDSARTPRLRALYYLGAFFGVAAILINQSRGAYGVLLWLLALAVLQAKNKAGAAVRSTFAALVVLGIITATAAIERDPLRIRQAWTDLKETVSAENFSTPVGARIYLFGLASETISQSPLIGIGPTERLRLIKSSGSKATSPQSVAEVVAIGHVHNAYLHHLLDGGVLSLLGFLLSVAGLVHAGITVRKQYPVTALQLWGIAFVHATTNLSNVNLAHNYYALMLSISLFLVFLSAQHQHPRLTALPRST
jgi:O-antigen ligase